MEYTKEEIQRSIDNVKRKLILYRELHLETVFDHIRNDCIEQAKLLKQRLEDLEEMLKEIK